MQVAIANFSEATKNERLDAQYFKPNFVNSYRAVISGPHSRLAEIAHITDGNHLKIAEEFDSEAGVRYLRGQDLGTDMMLSDRNVVHIPEDTYSKLKRSHIFKDDILVTIVGANTGLVGLVYSPPEKLVANCKLGIARPKDNHVLPGYLYAFLTCRYGQQQILRSIRGGGQTGLVLPDMRSLSISRFSKEFESFINDIVMLGHAKDQEAKTIFQNTNDLFLEELGLLGRRPPAHTSFIGSLKEAQNAERLDAEYFRPEYEEMIKLVQRRKHRTFELGELVTIKKSIEPGSEAYQNEGIPFVRVSNLSRFGISSANMQYISEDLYRDLKPLQPKKGEILLSKDATPGLAFFLQGEPEDMIVSGGIIRLQLDQNEILPEYLTLVLNSDFVKKQIERDAGGSIILHWRPDQIRSTIIPILDKRAQEKLKGLILKSFRARDMSRKLLQAVSRSVELAIEQGEHSARDWMNNQVASERT